jgi:hypothetical protein
MRVQHIGQRARHAALGDNDEPRGDFAGERDHLANGTDRDGLQDQYRHHCNAERRRPKSLAELRDGCELIELYDRRFPGRMSGRRP